MYKKACIDTLFIRIPDVQHNLLARKILGALGHEPRSQAFTIFSSLRTFYRQSVSELVSTPSVDKIYTLSFKLPSTSVSFSFLYLDCKPTNCLVTSFDPVKRNAGKGGTRRSCLLAVHIFITASIIRSDEEEAERKYLRPRMNRRMSRFFWDSLLLCCIVLVGFSSRIVGDEGGGFLNSKEAQVVELSKQALDNYYRRCEYLATCNNPSNCSHSVCGPLLRDLEGLTCTTVVNSTYCPAAGNSITPCTSMNLDFRRGYVRVAASTYLPSVDTMLSICSQRELDPVMKSFTSTDPSSFTRSYFASMDGSWRVLPGSARSDEDCRDFDPRNRPWFRTSTSVVKVVTVLIDLAASMNSNLPTSFGPGSMLQAAKTIASQLLPTLSADDYVNMIVFNSTGAYQLSPEAILVKDHGDTGQPELQPLLDELNSQTVEDDYRQSNLTAAILTALPNFDSNPLAAKVILIITDGVFATLGNVTLPTANLSSVKVFLYKLPRSNDTNDSLSNSTVTQQLCAVGGHFEPIRKNLENPLLVLSKYFSYLANLKRIETDGKPQYCSIYQDFEHIAGNISSVTKPTFSAEGDLIGVAGIKLHLELMGNLTNPVKNALLNRVTGYNVPSRPIILSAANCTVMNETTQPCGASSAYYAANGGLCEKTDLTSTIANLACCGACSVAGGSGKSDPKGLIIGFSVIGPLVVLVALGVGGFLFIRRRRAQLESDENVFVFRGTPEEPRSPQGVHPQHNDTDFTSTL